MTCKTDHRRAFKAQRQVLEIIRAWLREQPMPGFEHLRGLAFSNQLVREARYWSGLKGLLLCSYALALAPSNEYARNFFRELLLKGMRKIRIKK